MHVYKDLLSQWCKSVCDVKSGMGPCPFCLDYTGREDKERGHQRSEPQGLYGYQPSRIYPMGQPSPPVYILRAPHTAPMPGIPQYRTPTFEPRTRERKIIQIKDPNRNKDKAQGNSEPAALLESYR